MEERHPDWKMDYSKCTNVTSYDGKILAETKLEKDKRNYQQAWSMFREQFRSQPTRDITGRSGSYSPNLEQIEMVETKTDEI